MKKFFLLIFLGNFNLIFSQTLQDIYLENILVNKDTIAYAELFNNTESDIYLHNVKLIDSLNVFTLLQNNSMVIPSGNSLKIPLKFSPLDNVNYYAYLICELKTPQAQYAIMSKIIGKATHFNEIYKPTDNIRGSRLLNVLKTFVQPHTSLTYKEAREFMWGSLDNVDGYVECIYTGRKVKTSGIPDVNTTRFNTEHTWPQSLGAENEPPKSDLYHIRPTYEIANTKRANYPLGYVSKNVSYEDGGSRLGQNTKGEIVFEPRTSVRGDIARGMFYFALRYDNPYNYINSQLNDLKEFARLDPVDSTEFARNLRISEVQNNRNPFIDNNNFIFRINTFSDPDLKHFSHPVVSSSEITLLNENNSSAYLYIANYGDDTLKITNYSFNQYNNGKSYFFRLDPQPGELHINPYQIEKIRVWLDAQEPVDEWFEANLNLFFSGANSFLIPITFKVKDQITSLEKECNYRIYQNKDYLFIATKNILNNLQFYTLDGRAFEFAKYSNYTNFIAIPKSFLPCKKCPLILYFTTESKSYYAKVIIE